jgi:RNA polymerase sigma-70 factor (ECF subfamily)
VQAALRQVPVDFRAALVLCDLYGFPHAQAAEILEIPVGTVKSRLFRGRLALGERLAAAEAAPETGRRDRPEPEVVRGRGTQAVVGASEPAEPEHRSKEE